MTYDFRDVGVRLGKSDVPALDVPGELLTFYQPVIGYRAVFLWIHLRFCALTNTVFSLDGLEIAGYPLQYIRDDLDLLDKYKLVSGDPEEALTLHDPLPGPLFLNWIEHVDPSYEVPEEAATLQVVGGAEGPDTPSGADEDDESPSSRPPADVTVARSAPRAKSDGGMLQLVEAGQAIAGEEDPDMKAVVQMYQKRIGMIGPTQYEKLRFWIEEQGVEGAVIAVAIEETVRSAEVPRISYLEAILRNWVNAGIRSFAELQKRKKASKVLSGGPGHARESSREGTANASAYEHVSADKVAKWKELYPDEYDH